MALREQKKRGGHMSDIRPPEIELEIKREIEKGQAARTCGRYQNVVLSEKDLAELKKELPALWESYVERLSEYMASTGKSYKNHAATIRR